MLIYQALNINIIKLKEENGEVTMNKADFEGLIGEVESLIDTVDILVIRI